MLDIFYLEAKPPCAEGASRSDTGCVSGVQGRSPWNFFKVLQWIMNRSAIRKWHPEWDSGQDFLILNGTRQRFWVVSIFTRKRIERIFLKTLLINDSKNHIRTETRRNQWRCSHPKSRNLASQIWDARPDLGCEYPYGDHWVGVGHRLQASSRRIVIRENFFTSSKSWKLCLVLHKRYRHVRLD